MMDVPRLFAMWNAGARVEDIALAFGVSPTIVYRWRREYALPLRDRPSRPQTPDPTPTEIQRLADEIFRKNLEKLRAENPDVTRARVYRERGGV